MLVYKLCCTRTVSDIDEVDKKRMKPLPFGGSGSGGTGWNPDRGENIDVSSEI